MGAHSTLAEESVAVVVTLRPSMNVLLLCGFVNRQQKFDDRVGP